MSRHLHMLDWLLREVRYKVNGWRRGIYVYQPTAATKRTLGTVVRELFIRRKS